MSDLPSQANDAEVLHPSTVAHQYPNMEKPHPTEKLEIQAS